MGNESFLIERGFVGTKFLKERLQVMTHIGLPNKQGLYDPQYEHDACGIGFVANIKGKKTNDIVHQALTILTNLDHRGGQGSETNTGDGAGILMQIPHKFLQKETDKKNITLPEPGNYGVGMLFLTPDPEQRRQNEKKLEQIVEEEGQTVLGWRTVPVDNTLLGTAAKSCQPFIRQIFVGKSDDVEAGLPFERKLYVIRKRAENEIREAKLPGGEYFYFASFSSRTIVYKGMLTTDQMDTFYLDLRDPVRRDGPCSRPFPLQHQHVPQLGARPSEPLCDSQRRNQHAAGQYQLDEGTPGHV